MILSLLLIYFTTNAILRDTFVFFAAFRYTIKNRIYNSLPLQFEILERED